MLTEPKKNMLKLLIAVAWADGRVDEKETGVLEELLDSYGADARESQEIREWAKQPRSLDDVETGALARSDAELALAQAVLVTFVDGEQTQKEIDLLCQLAAKLDLPEKVSEAVVHQATLRAQDLLAQMQ